MKVLEMRARSLLRGLLVGLVIAALAACETMPPPNIQRTGNLSHAAQAGTSSAGTNGDARTPGVVTTINGVRTQPLPVDADASPQAIIHRGTGQVINRSAAAAPPPNIGGTTGVATFNFEGESLQAVVKAILGDMLGQNYVIAPGVQGTVTLATPKPVSPAAALSLLEMVLGWNNARMIYSDGRYNIMPADQALAGTVAPRTGSAESARGFEVRAVPLRYISATEMEKILKPYARPNAIVSVDNGRNLITLGGTRDELENYLRTVQIFDVDWMSSMSVGVFPLQSGKATKVVADLEKVFGEQSKSPVAGMFRFLPLEEANAVMVITSQPKYLDDIQQWLERIDTAGQGVQLFSYELKYIKAKDLADRLAEAFGGSSRGGGGDSGSGAPSLMPGSNPTEIKDGGVDNSSGVSSAGIGGGVGGGDSGGGDSGGGLGGGSLSLNSKGQGNGAVTLEVGGEKVGVSAVDETNTLLVRTTGQAWRSIKEVIERIDVMPLQVHIEAQVAEVTLGGQLQYGVNWFFDNAVTNPTNLPGSLGGAGLPSVARRSLGSLAGSITPNGLGWTFLGHSAAAVISALDQITDVRLLQTPSVVVRNNAEATFNVGSRIPIASVSFNPGTGGTLPGTPSTFSQVQYLDVGTILKVRPRVTKDGMVFLDIVQEVSSPGSATNINGNITINTRRLKTEAAIQSGETVMLAGLISDGVTHSASGVPGLSRIPVIGSLFGTQGSKTDRSEVIVLLTPTIIHNPQEARDLTDEYGRRFRALEPLNTPSKRR